MENKLIQIVGGGKNQLPLVVLAKKLGLKVLVTDMHDNPPCRELADIFVQLDTTDMEGNLEVAVEHQIDAIMTDQTDVAVPTVAYVSETLGLKGIGYESSLRFTNKYMMRKYLQSCLPENLPTYHFFDEVKEALAFCEKLNFNEKYIVKPINSQGSKGVYVLDVYNFKDYISKAYSESRSKGILIEQFIEGFEYSVEAYVENGKVYNLALTKKYHCVSNDCIDIRNTYLGDVSDNLEIALFSLNEKVIKSLGLPFGLTHAEYKYDGMNGYIMEIAARGGGGGISSKIVPFLTGFEPNRALIHRLFDQPFEIKIDDYKQKFVVMKFFEFKPGKVKNIFIDETVISDLLVFQLDIKVGDTIKEIKDSRDRPGYFVVAGLDRDVVIQKEKEVENAINIEYEN
jgi:biotin carboxylase